MFTKVELVKTSLIAVLIVCMSFAANAQFELCGMVGMNFSNLRGPDKFDDNKVLLRTTAGVFANYSFNEKFSIQTELNYDGKGHWFEDFSFTGGTDNYEIYDLKHTLDYLTIPIFAKVTLGKKHQFYVEGGSYFGILLSAASNGTKSWINTENPDLSITWSFEDDVKRRYNSFDFGLLIGGGMIFPIYKFLEMFVDLRYNFGLIKVFEEEIPTWNVGPDAYNSVLGVSCGVVFNINSKSKK